MLTIKGLAFAIWTALCSFVPPGDQTRAWREPEAHAAGRYFDLASDIARVVLDPDEPPLPLSDDDEEARARTGLLLASVAVSESALAQRVIDCRIKGPGGARGAFQCEGGQCAEACIDVTHAAKLAMKMLRWSFAACARLPLLDRASGYTDGKCIAKWPRSRSRVGRAVSWWKAHPFAEFSSLLDDWGDF